MQVVVKPVDSKKWHGKNGKDSFARPQTIEALFDSATGGYATGLTPELEEEYSKKLGVPLDNRFDYTQPHPTWSSKAFMIKLPNHAMVFNTTIAVDFVKVQILKASKFVANSLKEWEEGMFPEATHVIYDEAEETTNKATKVQQRNKCIVAISKMSQEEKVNMVKLLSDKSVRGRSAEFIDVELDKLMDEQDKRTEFIRYYGMDKAEMTLRAHIQEALDRNILVKEGLEIKYMGEPVGSDVDDLVKYFQDPNHQTVKIALMEKLTA